MQPCSGSAIARSHAAAMLYVQTQMTKEKKNLENRIKKKGDRQISTSIYLPEKG